MFVQSDRTLSHATIPGTSTFISNVMCFTMYNEAFYGVLNCFFIWRISFKWYIRYWWCDRFKLTVMSNTCCMDSRTAHRHTVNIERARILMTRHIPPPPTSYVIHASIKILDTSCLLQKCTFLGHFLKFFLKKKKKCFWIVNMGVKYLQSSAWIWSSKKLRHLCIRTELLIRWLELRLVAERGIPKVSMWCQLSSISIWL